MTNDDFYRRLAGARSTAIQAGWRRLDLFLCDTDLAALKRLIDRMSGLPAPGVAVATLLGGTCLGLKVSLALPGEISSIQGLDPRGKPQRVDLAARPGPPGRQGDEVTDMTTAHNEAGHS